MQFNVNVGLQGIVTVCKKINNIDVPQLPQFNNLIVDSFIDSIYAGNGDNFSALSGIWGTGSSARAGTGTTPPQPSDTALVAPVLVSLGSGATTVSSGTTYNPDTDLYTITSIRRIEFAPVASNTTITELAFYTQPSAAANTSYPMVSRTLIKDGLGNPSSITLLAGEILVLFYQFVVQIKRNLVVNRVVKGVPTEIHFLNHLGDQISMFPFSYGASRGTLTLSSSNATSAGFTQNDFTFPAPFTTMPTSGWTINLANPPLTPPVNIAVGLKARWRFPLSLYNGNIRGFINQSFNPQNATIIKFNPAVPKNNQEIIDVELLTTYTRL